jgi:hypothetical protein
MHTANTDRNTDQIQDRDFHHTLVKIRSLVLDDFHRDHLLRFEILTFDDLSKSTLTEHVEDKVPILMARLFRAKNVVDVKNVVAIRVIVAVVLEAFARLRENSARVPGRFVFEGGVTYPVRRREMRRQSLQGLFHSFNTAPRQD